MNRHSLNRRTFMAHTAAGSLGLGLPSQDSTSAAPGGAPLLPPEGTVDYLERKERRKPFSVRERARPHIVLITADMISPDCYLPSRALSSHVRLPNIRSIGEGGARFDNAMCTSPLCGPSRASIFTGKYPPYLTNGERAPLGMKTDLDDDDTIFQEYLAASGYSAKHVGKCHVGAKKFIDAFGENDDAWNRWAPPLLEDDDYVAYLRDLGVGPPVYRKEMRGMQSDRTSPGNSYGGWIMQEDGSDFPIEAHYSVYLARKAAGKIDAALTQSPDAPLYLQLDFFDPHQPFSVPSELEERAGELRRHIRLPASYERLVKNDFEGPDGEPDIYRVYRRYWGAYDPGLVREYILCHCLQMEVVDHAVGILLDSLREHGLWNDSLIMFTGDHGEINGRLGLFDKGVYFQPDIFRVPLFMKPPAGTGTPGQVVGQTVSSLDISQTILDFAGLSTTEAYDGESLGPVVAGTGTRPVLRQVFQTGWHVGVNYGVGYQLHENSDSHWFYGYNIATGRQELYSMTTEDPVNLFYDDRYRDRAREIVLAVADILRSDRRWLGYWSTFRLHNADMLPRDGGDMQMFVPKKD